MNKKTCKTCVFFQIDPKPSMNGECRYNPPVRDEEYRYALYPRVAHRRGWCGKYKKSQEAT